MKNFITLNLCLFVLAFFSFEEVYAQPVNDNVCNATTIPLDGPAFTISNIDATAETGEAAIAPPAPIAPGPPGLPLCGPGGWCDGLIGHSLWFKFEAPASTAVSINTCGSDFDSQVALYKVADCANFGSFELIWAMDDEAGCGPGDGLSASIRIECLAPGEEYYVLIDDWQQNAMSPVDTGSIVLIINTEQAISPGVQLSNNPVLANPLCPGGSEGSIDIELISGVEPVSYLWSNNLTTQDVSNLPAGEYTVTVTDFCQSSVELSFTLEDPDTPEAVTLGNFDNQVLHPSRCGDDPFGGQIVVPVATGIPPFTYEWSTGDTDAILTGLTDGEYTVTITDGCASNNSTLVQTFYVGAVAGPDIENPATCSNVQIGVDHSLSSGTISKFSYNTDQTPGGNVHCRFQNPADPTAPTNGSISTSTHWRPFNLDDFNLTVEDKLVGVEIFVQNTINTLANAVDAQPGLPMEFRLFIVSSTDLDDPNLTLLGVDSVFTALPSTAADGSYSSYIIPFDGKDIGPGDLIAVSVRTVGDFGLGHFFNLGANLTDSPGSTTYLSECGLTSITKMDEVAGQNFQNETIMNLLFAKDQGLTYNWDGPVDDPSSPTPIAMGTESTTYRVTITDEACNTSFTDSVEVTCWTVNTINPQAATFSIQPNPSNGLFQLVNKGAQRNRQLQVFDLTGKMVYTEQVTIGAGGSKWLQLQQLAKGVYFAQLSHEEAVETYKLVIQ